MATRSTAKTSEPPDLARLLGKARPAWDSVRAFLDDCPGATSEWKFYGAKHGWQLKVTANRRALVYLIPREGRFTAALALREGAIAALRKTAFPAARLREIEEAREFSEGKPARVDVTGNRELPLVKMLVAATLDG